MRPPRLAGMDTKEGVVVEGFRDNLSVVYACQLNTKDIDRERKRVEQEIEQLQERLDLFNHQTRIAVDSSLLTDIASGELDRFE